MTDWPALTSNSEAARRAGGRRHYDLVRQGRAALRRYALGEFVAEHGLERGGQAKAARMLGVAESTVSRDLDKLFREMNEVRPHRCPICGTLPSSEEMGEALRHLSSSTTVSVADVGSVNRIAGSTPKSETAAGTPPPTESPSAPPTVPVRRAAQWVLRDEAPESVPIAPMPGTMRALADRMVGVKVGSSS